MGYFEKLIKQGYKYALFTYGDTSTQYLLYLEGAKILNDTLICAWAVDGHKYSSGGFPWTNCKSFKAFKTIPKKFK